MKIYELTGRECCEMQDLIPHPEDPPPFPRYVNHRFLYCKYCGQRHEFYQFTDAAGSTDSNYRPRSSAD